MNSQNSEIELSVVMPCLNEEKTLGTCIKKAIGSMEKMGIKGEVVISDNGSTDNSVEIAESLGARVVYEPTKGYGNALVKGITEARGKYVIMGDADESYDFSDIERFVNKLREGYDLVMGTRLKGEIKKGAMPLLHRIGNPLMTRFLNMLYKTGISDVHCGMRAFSKEAFNKLDLKCGGMEFASEFVIKAVKEKLKITEIPITLYKDGRERRPHLRTFHDGWRHLRFFLIYSPVFLYLLPGILLLFIGFLILISGLFVPIRIGNVTFDYHINFLAAVMAIIGFQLCTIGILARSFAYIKGFDKYDRFIERYLKRFSLERNLVLGSIITGVGIAFFVIILVKWLITGLGPLFEVRRAILAVTLFAIGFQYISSSFFLSMLLMESERTDTQTL
ncbi:MAG: glycosyltransferase family 2 protein [Candidatus Omnitrophota bacterium]